MAQTSRRFLDGIVVVLGVTLVVATGVAFAAHDDHSAGGGRAAGPPAAADAAQIKDFKFVPAAITVPAGTKITFTNQDSAPHTATSGGSPNADGVFDTGTLTKGQSRSVTLSEAGTFAYYCALHPFMKATVIVT